MLIKWLIYLIWRPFELFSRWSPLIPLQIKVEEVDPGVKMVCLKNIATRVLSKISGGYEYAVFFIIDDELLFDSGYAWGERALAHYLRRAKLETKITAIVNSHFHEDHCGNNRALLALCPNAVAYAHPRDIPLMTHPTMPSWYRRFLFGPIDPHPVSATRDVFVLRSGRRLRVHETPGHTPGHICLYDEERAILFGGDLFIDASLDTQLPEVNALDWIKSLWEVSRLETRLLLDGHGVVIRGRLVAQRLSEKIEFLEALRERVREVIFEDNPMTLSQVVTEVFSERSAVNRLSMSEGWMSVITSGDFSRSHLIRAFVDEAVRDRARQG